MHNPLVSIVTSAYNAEKTLVRTVESVLTQTYQHFEYIIVNHGSTDRTSELLEQFAEKDSRIRVFTMPENTGYIGKALNLALKHAIGTYISFLDADDWLDSDFLETYVATAERTQSEVIIGGFRSVNENGNILNSFSPPNKVLAEKKDWQTIKDSFFINALFLTCFDVWWNKLYHLHYLRTLNLLFPESRDIFSDSCFNHGWMTHYPKICLISYIGVNYFQHGASVTATYRLGHYINRISYVGRWKKFLDTDNLQNKSAKFDLEFLSCCFHEIAHANVPLEDALYELHKWYTHPDIQHYLCQTYDNQYAISNLSLAIQLLNEKYASLATDDSFEVAKYYNIIKRNDYSETVFDYILDLVFQDNNPCALGTQWLADYLTYS